MNDSRGLSKVGQVLTLIVLVGLLGAIWLGRQEILDWARLYGYTPPANVQSLSSTVGMTPYAQKLFYVNHPVIDTDRATFGQECPVGMEKTIVLGCYKAVDKGIFLYDPKDPRLQGVVQTTAAHEMLHAGYERLTSKERSRVNTLLEDYYAHGLTDERIKKTIDAYKAAHAPIDNEMHSIFGTEVAQLPPELEAYYKRYFTNRSLVIVQLNKYQDAFTSRQKQIAAYDEQLSQQKSVIDQLQQRVKAQGSDIAAMERQMNAYKDSENYDAYNQMVPIYNARINSYNANIDTLKSDIASYNQLVDTRNALALEESQLVDALSGTKQTERSSL